MANRDVHSLDPAQANWDAFLRAYHGGHQDYVTAAEKYNNFYLGEQWDAEDRGALEAEGRPALTLNEIMQVVNAVKGHYSETRADIQFKPRRQGASAEMAHVLTRLFDQILEANDYTQHVEPQVFDDGIIEDRGFLEVRMDFRKNVLGEVSIRPLDPRTVLLTPSAKSYDPAEWPEVTVAKWLTLDDVEAHYGKAARRRVEGYAGHSQHCFGDLSVKYESFGGDNTWYGGGADEPAIAAVRVIERQHRRLTLLREFVDLATGDTRIVPDHWEEERVQAVAQAHQLGLRKRVASRVRWTVTCDRVTLHDDWSPYREFTVVPYFPMFRRGRPSGIVRHLIDPQEQLNKIESQILHVVNTTANSGWVMEQGSLANMSEQDLENRGAETGLVLVYGRNRPKPEKIQPNQIPTGLENYAQKSAQYIQNIPGAAALLGGAPKASVSGVALDRAQSKALLGLQVVFDNLDFTRKLLARRVLDCIQTFYSEHRVYYVTDWRDPEEHEEAIEINAEVAGQIVNDVSLGVYDVVASSAPTRDTFEEMQFAQALELRNAGVMIPDHVVILASQLAGKRQIAEQVKQIQGLGEPTEAQLMQMQLEMQRAEAEVAELQARVAELQARALLQQARAEAALQGEAREQFDVQSRYEMELARLQADLAKKAEDLRNKLEIAQIHANAKQSLTRYNQQMNAAQRGADREAMLAREQLKQRGDLQKALLGRGSGA